MEGNAMMETKNRRKNINKGIDEVCNCKNKNIMRVGFMDVYKKEWHEEDNM